MAKDPWCTSDSSGAAFGWCADLGDQFQLVKINTLLGGGVTVMNWSSFHQGSGDRVPRPSGKKTQIVGTTRRTKKIIQVWFCSTVVKTPLVCNITPAEVSSHMLEKVVPVQSHNSFLDQGSRQIIVCFHRNKFCSVCEPLL